MSNFAVANKFNFILSPTYGMIGLNASVVCVWLFFCHHHDDGSRGEWVAHKESTRSQKPRLSTIERGHHMDG